MNAVRAATQLVIMLGEYMWLFSDVFNATFIWGQSTVLMIEGGGRCAITHPDLLGIVVVGGTVDEPKKDGSITAVWTIRFTRLLYTRNLLASVLNSASDRAGETFCYRPAAEQREEKLTAGAVLCGTARMPDPMLVPTMSATAPATVPLFASPGVDAACSPSPVLGPPRALTTTARRALSPGATLRRLQLR